MATSHATRQAIPVVGDRARLIDVLEALLELGRGELSLDECDVPCAPGVLTSWAATHSLDVAEYEIDDERFVEVLHRDRENVLFAVKRHEVLS